MTGLRGSPTSRTRPHGANLTLAPAAVKTPTDAAPATSDNFSSATDEAVARCESGVGGERSRSEAQAARGSLVLNRLVPVAGDPGARRDPETGFVYYSADWLSDDVVEAHVLRAVK